jgi:hypothetical protein
VAGRFPANLGVEWAFTRIFHRGGSIMLRLLRNVLILRQAWRLFRRR